MIGFFLYNKKEIEWFKRERLSTAQDTSSLPPYGVNCLRVADDWFFFYIVKNGIHLQLEGTKSILLRVHAEE